MNFLADGPGARVISDQIFLSGGGTKKQAIALDRRFAEAVRASGCVRCIYLPHAQPVDRFASCRNWFRKTYGLLFEDVLLPLDLDDAWLDDIRPVASDVIYLGGGCTGDLLTALRSSGWDQAIVEHARAGGLIYGFSAGAIALGPSIESAPESEWNAGSHDGLGLVPAMIVAHYEARSASRLRQLATLHQVAVWGIPEDGGVIVTRDGHARSVGVDWPVAHPER